MERLAGIEPASLTWKANTLTIVLQALTPPSFSEARPAVNGFFRFMFHAWRNKEKGRDGLFAPVTPRLIISLTDAGQAEHQANEARSYSTLKTDSSTGTLPPIGLLPAK